MSLISYGMDADRKDRREVRTKFHYDSAAEQFVISYEQDVSEILAGNKEMKLANDGYTQDRSMLRAARIPMILIEKIMREQGWNPMMPENSERLLQLLDDPNYAHLKTTEYNLAQKVRRDFFRGSSSPRLDK